MNRQSDYDKMIQNIKDDPDYVLRGGGLGFRAQMLFDHPEEFTDEQRTAIANRLRERNGLTPTERVNNRIRLARRLRQQQEEIPIPDNNQPIFHHTP